LTRANTAIAVGHRARKRPASSASPFELETNTATLPLDINVVKDGKDVTLNQVVSEERNRFEPRRRPVAGHRSNLGRNPDRPSNPAASGA